MKAVLFFALLTIVHGACTEELLGNGDCDRQCLSAGMDFDRGDCEQLCTCGSGLLGNSVCDEECNSAECRFDHGDCAECSTGCAVASVGNQVCDAACAVPACNSDSGDCVSVSVPNDLFVSGGETAPLNLAPVCESLWMPVNRVSLLRGSFSLAATGLLRLSLALEVTEVRGVLCSQTQVANCRDDRAEIEFSRDLALLRIEHTVIFSLVDFVGSFSLKGNCQLPTCRYCPYLTSSDAEWKNDQGATVDIADYAESWRCEEFHSVSLISVQASGTLRLISTAFRGFRQQLHALISAECGLVDLDNVDFTDCMASPDATSGLIVMSAVDAEEKYRCGTLSYVAGSVARLNAGYAYRKEQNFAGFLRAVGSVQVAISAVSFLQNYTPGSALVTVQNFRTVEIANCTFAYNAGGAAGCMALSTSLTYPTVLDSAGTSTEHLLPHIALTGLNFTRNSAYRRTLCDLKMEAETQNVKIERWTAEGNAALQDALIAIVGNANDWSALSGGMEKKLVGTTVTNVYVPPRFMSISQLAATNNSVSSFLSVTAVANLQLSLLSLSQCGSSYSDALADILSAYNAYPLGSIYEDSSECGQLVTISALNVTAFGVTFRGNNCENGSPGLLFTGNSTYLHISAVSFSQNRGSSLLQLHTNSDVVVSHLDCSDNVNDFSTQPLCVDTRKTAASSMSVIDSDFLRNKGGTAVVALVLGVSRATFRNLRVQGNAAKYAGAGILFDPLATGLSELLVSNCSFTQNAAANFGMVTLLDYTGVLSGNSVARVRLRIDNCTFSAIATTAQGAGVTVNNYVQVTSDSRVASCSFERCSSQRGGGIYLSYQTGVVTIEGSRFEDCEAPEGGAAVFAHQFPQSTVPTYVVLANSTVAGSSKGAGVFLNGYDGSLISMFASGNSFSSNCNGAWLLSAGRLQDSFSQYRNNSSLDGAVFNLKSSLLAVANVSADGNRADALGGFLFLSSSSTVDMTGAVLRNNTAEIGGVAYADQGSTLRVADSEIVGNSAKSRGAVLYSFTSTLALSNVLLTLNSVGGYAAVLLTETNCSLSSVVMSRNTAVRETAGIVLTASSLTVNESTFSQQTSDNGSFLQAQSTSRITVSRSVFEYGHAEQEGGAIYAALQSVITIEDSQIRSCSAGEYGGAVYIGASQLYVRGSRLETTTAQRSGGGIYAFSGWATITQSHFTAITGGSLSAIDMNSLSVTASVFADGVATVGAGVYVENSSLASISASEFRNLSASTGAALCALSNGLNPVVEELTVSSCVFEANSADSGGAIAVDSCAATVRSSSFQRNEADSEAGALQLSCSSRSSCPFQVTDNSFRNNSAGRKAGAIQWTSSAPQFSGNAFAGNSAPYGPDIASFPIALKTIDGETEVILVLVPSGQVCPTVVKLGLYDHAGQLVTFDSTSVVELAVGNNTAVSLSGSVKAQAQRGEFRLQGFTAVGTPGSVQSLHISLSNTYEAGIPSIPVTVHFRPCDPGESQYQDQCLLCPEGTYSLDPALPCQLCPAAAICYGNLTMVPKNGYWRTSVYTDVFIKCLREEACVGSAPPPEVSLLGMCGEGYSGNLCDTCKRGFSRSQAYSCAQCTPVVANLFICFVVVLALALVTYALISSALTGGGSSELPVYLKAMLNYAQMIVVTATLDLSWPYFVQTFLEKEVTVGNFSEQLFSFECLIEEMRGSNSDMFAVKLGILVVLPALLMCASSLVWLLMRLLVRVPDAPAKLQCSSVVILSMLHPTLTRHSFSVFACLELSPGHSYMLSDMSLECWQSSHTKLVLLLAAPCIIVWVVGLPALVLVSMVRHTRRAPIVRSLRYSFLSRGFEETWYWWEFVILARKLLMICASVFLISQSVQVQALTILAVLLAALLAQVAAKPFLSSSLNVLELKSILVSAATIYAGLYYSTRSISTLYADASVRIALFVMLLTGNGYFLFTWGRFILPLVALRVKMLIRRWATCKVHSELSGESPRQPPSSSRRILPIVDEDSQSVSPPCNSSVLPGPACEQVTFQLA